MEKGGIHLANLKESDLNGETAGQSLFCWALLKSCSVNEG